MKRTLVTGATGFIGGRLVQALLAAGYPVAALARRRHQQRDLGLGAAQLVYGDLSDTGSLRRALEGVEVVFHLASLLKMPWKAEFREVNVEGTRRLLEACAACDPAPAVVLVSSLTAGGPSAAGAPRAETERPAPVSIYGRTKLAAERAAAEHAARVPLTIARPPMVLGAGDRYGLALFRSVGRGLHLIPRPGAEVSWVEADELARALILLAERGERLPGPAGEDGPAGQGVYYAAAAEPLAYAELGRQVAGALGAAPPRVLPLPSWLGWTVAAGGELAGRLCDRPVFLNTDKWREARAGSWTCRTDKLAALGFRHAPLLDSLGRTIGWYRAQGWLPPGPGPRGEPRAEDALTGR